MTKNSFYKYSIALIYRKTKVDDCLAQTAYQSKNKINKKMLYASISIVIIIVALLAMYNSMQNDEQNEINIKITNSSIADGYGNPVGITCDRWFSVTIQNKGENNVTGLLLDIKVFINNTECDNYDIAYLYTSTFNSTLNAQEIKEFQGTVLAPMNGPLFFERKPADEIFIQVRVMMDDAVLDEVKIPF